MPYQWQAQDIVEPISDTNAELAANSGTYNVISGCGMTYSIADMTVTVAAGVITLNGATIVVAGNVVTLVSDPSNPRWTWIGINSSGVAVVVSGTPAAAPAVPELGDLVSASLNLIQTNQTIANNIVTQLDKRVPASPYLVPKGAIIMWSGTIATIPAGWLICDGTNGTPNLLSRFVQGVASAVTNPGTTGGASTAAHDTLGAHTHDDHGSQATPHLFGQDVTVVGVSTSPTTHNSQGAHAHATHSIIPPYYALAFLMKS